MTLRIALETYQRALNALANKEEITERMLGGTAEVPVEQIDPRAYEE
jgi:hypothetical protein